MNVLELAFTTVHTVEKGIEILDVFMHQVSRQVMAFLLLCIVMLYRCRADSVKLCTAILG